MTIPTIHLNGTSRESLITELETAVHAIDEAIAAVCAAAPNGRDYYPQGPQAFGQAQDEHYARLAHLTTVKDELIAIYEAIAN